MFLILQSAYYGFMEQLRLVRRAEVKQKLLDANKAGALTDELIDDLVMDNWPKEEKIANKDIKASYFHHTGIWACSIGFACL